MAAPLEADGGLATGSVAVDARQGMLSASVAHPYTIASGTQERSWP